jgi:signal transduction histidine kinase/CheY-like chemotaxis protein
VLSSTIRGNEIRPVAKDASMNSDRTERPIRPFPATAIAASSLVSLMLLGWILWNLYDGSSRAINSGKRMLALEELRAEIILLDEVLTTSAILAATTGAPQWIERYGNAGPKLDAALGAAIDLAQTPAVIDAIKRISDANVALVEMERQALARIHEGRLEAGQAILFGERFADQKRIYKEGLDRLEQALDDRTNAIIESMWSTVTDSVLGGAAASVAIIVTWLHVLGRVHGWRQVLFESLDARARAEQALRESHDELERLVGERTRDLQHEISLHEEAREALVENRAFLQMVLDTLPLSVDLRDREGRYVFVNAYLAAFRELPSETLVGKTPIDLFGAEAGDPYMERHRRTIESDATAPNVFEHSLVDASGVETMWLTTKVPVRIEGDAFGGVVTSSLDITDRKIAQTKLLQVQKFEAIGQLTSGIAHDFNNLLTIILGNLQLLERSLASDTKESKRVLVAIEATLRGAKLTDRLLAFARKQNLDPISVDTAGRISGMSDLIVRTISEEIETKFVLADDLWPCTVDPAQLENAILNLAINARDAMPEGGKLTIEANNRHLDDQYIATHPGLSVGDYVAIAVSDTGCGMSPAVVEHAFEPFFTTKEVGKGSGLGLAMVYGFVKQSGGYVNLYSEPGHGTTVRLYFPRSEGPAVAAPERVDDHEALSAGVGTILVVEDEAGVRDVAVTIFEDIGYQVVSATNGQEALAILDERPDIDLLFTDVVMPGGMTGVDLMKEARTRRPKLKVICTSGYAAEALNHSHDFLHDVTVVQKPYSRDDLTRVINQAMHDGGRRSQR